MLKLICKIEIIGKETQKVVTFEYVNSIEVKTSIKNLTDTATVKVPRKISWKGKPITDFISVGDKITISAGYEEFGIQTLFKGYLKSIKNVFPIILECENEMYNLKRITVKPENIAKFDLKKFVEKYVNGVKMNVPENLTFGSLNIQTEMTMAQALDAIIQKYPYLKGCYFKDGEFYAVFRTVPSAGKKPIVFSPEKNMISDNLTYTLEEDIKIGVKAVAILSDNSKLEAYAPAVAFTTNSKGKKNIKKGYGQRQFFAPQCKTQKELEYFAKKTDEEWITDKMSGTFTAFGVPHVEKGDIVELRDSLRPERNKKHFVAEGITYNFGTNGFRQVITLGDFIKH
ncbi:MAG: hypothetical protein LBS50_10685 [Prevotellaceae bacterium]|jgi:hypothetical protein|nr:hypothetical protein [Prevotellaceae bacterium]